MACALWAANPRFDEARKLYDATEFQQSLHVLNAIPDKDAEVHELTGRNHYMLGDFKRASEALERACNAQPSNAEYALWLGRAYGRRAETSGPFTAAGWASKARQYFEKAARLNPRNLDALSDLFEYYLEAPGILGGGMDKAQTVAGQMAHVDPSEGYWAMYKLAEERKDYSRAEEQLRRAVEVAPRPIGKLIELARTGEIDRPGRNGDGRSYALNRAYYFPASLLYHCHKVVLFCKLSCFRLFPAAREREQLLPVDYEKVAALQYFRKLFLA